jgi:hypothetical protein
MSLFDNLPLPPVYYHGREASYWREDDRGGWIKVNESAVRLFVADQGYAKKAEDSANAEADDCLLHIQDSQNVAYVGPLAGYSAGIYEMVGNKILVTNSPKFIESRPGEWPVLERLFEGMFVDGELDQRPYFFAWVKKAMETFKSGSWRASQMLALAGDVGSGKSLTQNLLTEIFGGRSAKPYQYMRGGTEFNSHCFAGEHLILEDESESVDPRSRKHFAAMLKTLLCARDQVCHAKHREALTLRPLWRMSVSLNDDPERLLVLPPLDDDVRDKIIALKVVKCEMPMPTSSDEGKELFWRTMVSELPAFLHYLEHWTIPAEIADARFGVRAYQHPDIVEKLNATNSEDRLLELVDLTRFHGQMQREPWSGLAAELERMLTSDTCSYRNEAKRLLSWNAACGAFLGRLEKSNREFVAGRVTSRVSRGRVIWTINPPQRPEPTPTTPGLAPESQG